MLGTAKGPLAALTSAMYLPGSEICVNASHSFAIVRRRGLPASATVRDEMW